MNKPSVPGMLELIADFHKNIDSGKNYANAEIEALVNYEPKRVQERAADSQKHTLVHLLLEDIGNSFTKPVLWEDLILGLSELPVDQWRANGKSKLNEKYKERLFSWANPTSLKESEIFSLLGLSAIRESFARNRKKAKKELSPSQLMLLMAYKAKPRPISWSVLELPSIDMIAYMYQDVIAKDINIKDYKSADFIKYLPIFKDWLMRNPPKRGNSALRHLKVRLGHCLNVPTVVIDRVLKGQSEHHFIVLMKKLIECEDDRYYSEGGLRKHTHMRKDFNLLTEFAIRTQFGVDSIQYKRIMQIKCPGLYKDGDFSKVSLRVLRVSSKKNSAKKER